MSLHDTRKREKFVELAEKRTQRVIDSLESLGKLHNKRNYSYTESDYKKIFRAVKIAFNEMRQEFEDKKVKEFRLNRDS